MRDPRLARVDRGPAVSFTVDGVRLRAHVGETVATAMLAAGSARIRRSARRGEPRGVFCGMGVCFECLVRLDGRAVRACMTLVEEGMELRTWQPEAPR